MRRRDKKMFYGTVLAGLLLLIGLGYAVLGANLTINGNSKLAGSTWDIHFNNVVPKSGSVAIGTGDHGAVITQGDTTEVTYAVTLSKPGDFYEFNVDAVNAGTVDGMIDTITSTYKIGEGEVTPITSNNLPAYLSYSATYSNGVTIAQNQLLEAGDSETYKVRIEFKRDIENNQLPATEQTLTFNFAVNYVQADDTAIEVVAPAFNEATPWEDIVAAAQAGSLNANVGDTKTVDLGTFGTHTLRVANTTTPAECSTTGFSQTACGLVLEFADIITSHAMNSTDTNVGGWPASEMRTYVNSDIYNSLPTALKNAIIDTTVVSGHGSTSGETNFTSTDKLYLLSAMELWENNSYSQYDSARDLSRQMDYYSNLGVNNSNYSGAIKQKNGSNSGWRLRSARSTHTGDFFYVNLDGRSIVSNAYNVIGVSPAFRLR